MTIRKMVYEALNNHLLKPFGVKLVGRIGYDPVDDLCRLVARSAVSTIIDGGAYAGTFSRQIAKTFPQAKVHAFEPTPNSYVLLREKTQHVASIVPHQLALGARSETKTIYGNASPMTNSLLANSGDGERYFKDYVENAYQTDVCVTTLREFFQKEEMQRAEIIKLDLQGGELDAIIGLGEAINGVQAFFLEISFLRLYAAAPLFTEIESYLRERGFSFYQFYDLVRSPIDGRLLYGDCIFVRNELLSERG